MATGASTADLAVLLIDARKGVLVQTKRHATICSLLGIRHIVVAVNKIDLVDWDQAVFDRIVADFAGFAAEPRLLLDRADPDVGALSATMSPTRSGNMTWYHGPSLLEHLETVDIDSDAREAAVPLPGAMGQPPQSRFPRLCRHGRLGRRSAPGDAVVVAASGKTSTVTRIVTADGDLAEAQGRRRRHAHPRRRDRCGARRRARRRRPRGRRSPTSSPPTSSGCPRRPCFPAAPT